MDHDVLQLVLADVVGKHTESFGGALNSVDAAKRADNGGGKESVMTDVRSHINDNVAGLQETFEDFTGERLVVQEIEIAKVDGLQLFRDVQPIGRAVHRKAIVLEEVGGNGTSQPVLMKGRKCAANGLRKHRTKQRGIDLHDSRDELTALHIAFLLSK
jgi:hypothetical protein